MWIMDLRDEFEEAVDSIRDHHFHATTEIISNIIISLIVQSIQTDHFVSFFETTIRYLGGALSAYALSAEPILLRHAESIAQVLLPAFTGTESGLPAYSVNVKTYSKKIFFLPIYFVTHTCTYNKFHTVVKPINPKDLDIRSQKRLLVKLNSSILPS